MIVKPRFYIGDKVIFKGREPNYPLSYSDYLTDEDGLPREYIIHGSVVWSLNPPPEIVDILDGDEFDIADVIYLVKYKDEQGKDVQLGFVESFLKLYMPNALTAEEFNIQCYILDK